MNSQWPAIGHWPDRATAPISGHTTILLLDSRIAGRIAGAISAQRPVQQRPSAPIPHHALITTISRRMRSVQRHTSAPTSRHATRHRCSKRHNTRSYHQDRSRGAICVGSGGSAAGRLPRLHGRGGPTHHRDRPLIPDGAAPARRLRRLRGGVEPGARRRRSASRARPISSSMTSAPPRSGWSSTSTSASLGWRPASTRRPGPAGSTGAAPSRATGRRRPRSTRRPAPGRSATTGIATSCRGCSISSGTLGSAR